MSINIPEYDWTPTGMVGAGAPVYIGSWVQVADHKRVVAELQAQIVILREAMDVSEELRGRMRERLIRLEKQIQGLVEARDE